MILSRSLQLLSQAGEPKPEVLDDWDQRLVVTTLQVDEEGHRLELQQVAEKDQVSEECFVSLFKAFRDKNYASGINITQMGFKLFSQRVFRGLLSQKPRSLSVPASLVTWNQ